MSDKGRFVWYELLTTDPEGAKDFYGAVTGWTTRPFGGGPRPYSIWMAGETSVGGVMELSPEMLRDGVKPHWWAHVAVDTIADVDASARRAEQLGGRIIKPGMDIPEVGRFAIITDPQGAMISLFRWTGGEQAPPAAMRPGHVAWHELHTTDHEGAWAFYSQLFGWRHTTSLDMGEWGTYFMFRHPDDPEDAALGGMFNGARGTGAPPHWLYYVTVDGMDAAVRRIGSHGGTVVNGPMDVPGGGRAAQCLDPRGALFAIFSMK